ncbi:YihY/virulence factor BrkB family protein [Enterococcus lemanii]|jgi:membrane protein|uniref:YihY/virulence factor BrkB family protein n=1 Tax=Enterococcus lemanii TaxID=1159752 RepID=A0ABV9MZJ3_9ENTE|nr:YihY/virulence factor BrkB family protein [Enterococcus lemanii]MBM7708137.1 membrane protein [Enterococcus lemanii]
MKKLIHFFKQEKTKRFLSTVQIRIKESEMTQGSIVIAYYLLLSLFPLLIAVGNVLPFLQINPNTIMPYLQEVIPEPIYEFLGPAIQDLLTQSSGSLLSFSALLTLWSASVSMNALQLALNKAYGVKNRENFIIVRIVSVLTVFVLLLAIVGVTIVVGAGKLILDQLQPIFLFSDHWISTFQTVKWPLTVVALLTLMAVIYSVIPNVKVHLRSILPGAFFATIGWMVLSQGFGIYARYFASRLSAYQIIGSFIVLMLWLNFAAMIIILGGIINAVVEEFVYGQIKERKGPIKRLSLKMKRIWKK